MRRLLVTRSLRYALSGAVILLLNFLLPRLMPGDPIVHLVGVEDYYRYPDMVAQLKARHGLDQPLSRQLEHYLLNLAQGHLGYSFHYSSPVGDLVLRRLKWSLVLALPSLLLGGALAVLAGGVAGWNRGSWWERWLTLGLLVLKSVPQYGLAMLALFFLAFRLHLFPLGGAASGAVGLAGLAQSAQHALLPLLILALFSTAHYYLIVRNSVADLRDRPFIAAARARGLSQTAVLFRHALRNALLPFLTLLAMGLGFSVGGALLVEIVFSWPGMGTLVLSAVESRDYPLLQGCFLVLTLSVLAANYIADLAYGLCDPRVRLP